MNYDDVVKLQHLYYELRKVNEELIVLRSRLAELREAKRLLKEVNPSRIFREVGGLIIEVDLASAIRYVEEEAEIIELRINQLEKKRRELAEEIKRLESEIKLRYSSRDVKDRDFRN